MFQHVQTEIKKKRTDRLTQNFEVCYANLDIPVILFTLTFSIILPFDNSNLKKNKQKSCNPTNQSLRHLKNNTCI